MEKKHKIGIGLICFIIIICVAISLIIGLKVGPIMTSQQPVIPPSKKSEVFKYLSNVYPASRNSLLQLSDQDLLKFYNSLGWYYNCCYTCPCWVDADGKEDIIVQIPIDPYGTAIDKKNWPTIPWLPIGCCDSYSLPLVPSGNLYDWASYQYFGVPIISSDSKNMWFTGVSDQTKIDITKARGDVSTFASQSLLINPFEGISSKYPYTNKGTRTGPGAFFGGYRSIEKAAFYPFGPIYDPKKDEWSLDGRKNENNNWLKTITDNDLEKNLNLTKNNQKWYFGYKENEYIEICHIEYFPGLAYSTGYWFNHYPGGGTGIFYKIGKTPSFPGTNNSPRNKISMLFTLISEVASCTKANNKSLPCYTNHNFKAGCKNIGGGQTFQYGDELLHYMYETTDPYEIVFKYCGSNGYWKNKELAIAVNDKPFVYLEDMWLSPAIPSQKLIYGNVGWDFVSSVTKLGTINGWTKRNPNDPNVYSPTWDTLLNMFNNMLFENFAGWLMTAEFGEDSVKKNYGSYSYENNEWTLKPAGIKYAIDKAMQSNWLYDRASNGVPFDEPNFYFGTILGYETLQMPVDANTSTGWSFEIIDLRLPEDGLQELYNKNGKKYPDNATEWRKEIVSNRRYPYIITDPNTTPPSTSYLPYASMLFEQNFTNIALSMRDPLDIKNESKILPCNVAGGFKCDGSPEVKCSASIQLDEINQPSDKDKRYYYGKCTTTNTKSLLSGTNTTTNTTKSSNYKITGKLPIFDLRNHQPVGDTRFSATRHQQPIDPISAMFVRNSLQKSEQKTGIQGIRDDENVGSVDIIMDKTNNLCMPVFANSFDETKDIAWDGLGNVYCQADPFPTNVFWGNIEYGGFAGGETSGTAGKKSVILPNINLF